MVDFVHPRTAREGDRGVEENPDEAPAGAHRDGPPRTDIGTIVIHWLTVAAMVTSLATGLRIAADAENALISAWLGPILPQGEIWTWHFVGGLGLFFCATAYILYMRRSGLKNRIALKKLKVMSMPAAARLKWGAANVALYWAIYAIVTLMTVTGIFLYLGYGGWLVVVHRVAAYCALAYIFIHVVSHYFYGGWPQLLRVFRPSALVPTRAMRPRPLLVGLLIGVPVAGAIAAADFGTRDTLVMAAVDEAPVVDGILDDDAWDASPPVTILTQQGSNLGGTGESTVHVQAVNDGERAYFAFRWSDPTRSLRRVPIIKREDGWHLVGTRVDIADVIDFYEDKLSVVFSRSNAFGGGGGTHLGTKPLDDKPGALNSRGLHYTTDGTYIDMWQWKASRGGMIGQVDDQHIGPPREADEAQIARQKRYQAGYTGDPGTHFYKYNYKGQPPGGYRGPVEILRLPREPQAQMEAMNIRSEEDLERFLDPTSSDPEGTVTWMFDAESIEYTPEYDATIPVGTVIPGVLITGEYSGDQAHVTGAARWEDGWWTLEATRLLDTGSDYDQAFVPGETLYLWAAVFDHNQTRHSRHVRPVTIEVEGPAS